MLTVLTRTASSSLGDCALSFLDRTPLDRTPIDIDLARRQHRAYEDALHRLGARVISLPAAYPATLAHLERRGFHVHALDVSEPRKAEAGVTCRGIIFEGA